MSGFAPTVERWTYITVLLSRQDLCLSTAIYLGTLLPAADCGRPIRRQNLLTLLTANKQHGKEPCPNL